MERQQFMDYNMYEDDWASPQVISNYHEGDEDISLQDILKRARAFKISPKSFHLPTNERQMKGSSFRTMQMSFGNNFERGTHCSDMYYPDLSECLDSTLEGSSMMSCLSTHDTAESKAAFLETPKPNPVENSLDEYERIIEKARQTAEKYSVTEDPITKSPVEKSVTFLEKLKSKADDAPVQRSCESFASSVETKAALLETPKQQPISNSLDDYEQTIERARQIAEKYCVTEDLITEAPKQMPLIFLEKLKLKTDDAPLERSCEKIPGLTTASYLQTLKSKREEQTLDSTAEICVKAVLNKIQRELYVEAIRENALKQRTILETFDLHQNGEQQNVALKSSICDSYNTADLKKPKVSLLSSAHGFQWMEETKTSKRKSWRKRLAGLFCLRRCGNI